MPLRRWGAALAFLAGAATACSGARPAEPSKVPQEFTVPNFGLEAKRLVFPFDAYKFSPAETMTLEVADDLLVRDCMRARDLAWTALPGPPDSESEPPHRRRYGVIEPALAGVFGYHVAPDRPAVATRKKDDVTRRENASAKVQEAADQCLDQTQEKIAAGVPEADAAFFNERIFASFDASQRDEKVLKVFRAWSRCMAGEGFDYPDPLTAITDERWQTKRPSAQEIRTAQADVRCKERTGLVAVWAAAETRIQNDVVRNHPEKFRVLKAVKDQHLAAAHRIIARG
jgi:hypothetical protein